jgi:hypothetical protein
MSLPPNMILDPPFPVGTIHKHFSLSFFFFCMGPLFCHFMHHGIKEDISPTNLVPPPPLILAQNDLYIPYHCIAEYAPSMEAAAVTITSIKCQHL